MQRDFHHGLLRAVVPRAERRVPAGGMRGSAGKPPTARFVPAIYNSYARRQNELLVPTVPPELRDRLGRPLRNLRLSVTDRCNLRCEYCMPEDEYVWLPREDVLNFEETSALVDVFIALGVDKVRLTGGEPLLRRDLPALVRMLAAKPGLRDLALTTNGVLLQEQIDALKTAGLGRITVSLDTLRAECAHGTRRQVGDGDRWRAEWIDSGAGAGRRRHQCDADRRGQRTWQCSTRPGT